MDGRKRGAGRPTAAPREGQKSTLGIRASAELKARLNRSAKENARSLSQEAELRLEQSFRDELTIEHSSITKMIYGPQLAGVLALISDATKKLCPMAAYESTLSVAPEIDWLSDPFAYGQFEKAVRDILDALRPPGSPDALERTGKPPNEWWWKNLGTMMAGMVLDGARDPEGHRFPKQIREVLSPHATDRSQKIRELLGAKIADSIAFDWSRIKTEASQHSGRDRK